MNNGNYLKELKAWNNQELINIMTKAGKNQYGLFDSKLLNGITTLEDLIHHRDSERQSLLKEIYPANNKLSVLSFGGGQDSTALLCLYIFSKSFRERYAPEDFIVLMSDTGNEHPETYTHVSEMLKVCSTFRIPFYFITKDKGYHKGNWTSLTDFYKATNTCGSKAFRKNCTDNLKLKPIYRFLEDFLYETYNLEEKGKKKAYINFAEKYGKINMIIGIAKGEEKRVASDEKLSVWEAKTIKKLFPLIDLGMDRLRCQEYIQSVGFKVPPPSNCMICPYMSEIELLWLFYNYPEVFNEWVVIEKNKLEKFKSLKVNLGVWPDKHLPEKLDEAKKRFSNMSIEEINTYKFSHGHCVKSKY